AVDHPEIERQDEVAEWPGGCQKLVMLDSRRVADQHSVADGPEIFVSFPSGQVFGVDQGREAGGLGDSRKPGKQAGPAGDDRGRIGSAQVSGAAQTARITAV